MSQANILLKTQTLKVISGVFLFEEEQLLLTELDLGEIYCGCVNDITFDEGLFNYGLYQDA